MTREEKQIVRLRLQGLTFGEIGSTLELSRQRVQQKFKRLLLADSTLRERWARFLLQKSHRVIHRAYKPRKKKLRQCLGCGREFGANDMRTHKCSVNWFKRIGWIYSRELKRYAPPTSK